MSISHDVRGLKPHKFIILQLCNAEVQETGGRVVSTIQFRAGLVLTACFLAGCSLGPRSLQRLRPHPQSQRSAWSPSHSASLSCPPCRRASPTLAFLFLFLF